MTSRTALVLLALLVTWLVWGSSFFAISFALETFPPLLLMATRFVVAGAITTVVGLWLARRAGVPLPGARKWRHAMLLGLGFVTIGMGASGWSAARLPTGIASLLVASAPLWMAALQSFAVRDGGRRSRVGLLGLAIGIFGVGILVVPGGGSGSIDAAAAVVLIAGTGAWAAASVFAPRADTPDGLVLRVGMQMLTGGTALLVVALATGEGRRLDLGTLTTPAAAGWTWLVLAASIGGYLAYGWLLEHVGIGTASTHAFVNPLVGIALGATLLGEQVGSTVVIAGAAVVVAVVLLLVGEARTRRPDPAPVPAVRRIARPLPTGRRGRSSGWSPTPTPAFAARRAPRPWQATDGMDALAIDEALDGLA